jgi:hypothetical protein
MLRVKISGDASPKSSPKERTLTSRFFNPLPWRGEGEAKI